jgi:hypothetical protein
MAIMNFKTDKERNEWLLTKEIRQMSPGRYIGEGCEFIEGNVSGNPNYPYLEILELENYH